MFHEGIFSYWKVTFRYYLLCSWWSITHSSVLSIDLAMNIQLLITIMNARCSAILRFWYSASVIQMNQRERGYSTTHVTHKLMWWNRSSSIACSGGGKVSLETEMSTNFKLWNLSEGTWLRIPSLDSNIRWQKKIRERKQNFQNLPEW